MKKAFCFLDLIILIMIESSSSFAGSSNIPDWMLEGGKNQRHISDLGIIFLKGIIGIGFIIGFMGFCRGLLELNDIVGYSENGQKHARIGLLTMGVCVVLYLLSFIFISIIDRSGV